MKWRFVQTLQRRADHRAIEDGPTRAYAMTDYPGDGTRVAGSLPQALSRAGVRFCGASGDFSFQGGGAFRSR